MNAGLLIHRLKRVLLLCTAGILAACTVITDFDESKLKTSLDEVLIDENISLVSVSESVSESGSETAMLTFRFSKAFTGKDKAVFDRMVGQSLNLVLADNTALPDAVITRNRVSSAPAQSGDFSLTWDATGRILVVSFFNPPAAQFLLTSGEQLTLIIDISENPLLYDDILTYGITVD